MAVANKNIDKRLLQSLVPLGTLSPDKLDELAAKSSLEEYPAGRYLFRAGELDRRYLYLLAGEIELLSDGEKSTGLKAGSRSAREALAPGRPRPCSARAKSRATVLVIDSDLLELLLGDEAGGYEVTEIEGDGADDWMIRFLQSPAFSSLPTQNIQAVLTRLEPLPLKAGETVIRQGDSDSYYYIVESGRCVVTRRPAPRAPEIRLAELEVGDGFGEEGLLTRGRRNATVTMLEDGVLMRLGRENFDELLAKPLMRPVSAQQAVALVEDGGALIDVRGPEEFGRDGLAGASNIPLSTLRLKLSSLYPSRAYVVYANANGRSAAAAFLMAQQGLNVHVLNGGLQRIGDREAIEMALREHHRPNAPAIRPPADQRASTASGRERLAAIEQRAAAEDRRALAAENTARKLHAAAETAKRQAQANAARLAEAESARKQAEAELSRLHEAARAEKEAELEAARRHAQAEAERLRAAEVARLRAQRAATQAQDEAADTRRRAEEETAHLKAEAEEIRRAAEAEAKRLRGEAEAARRRAEQEAQRLREDAMADGRSAAEMRERAEAEAARLREEAEHMKRQAEEEALRLRSEVEAITRELAVQESERVRAAEAARRKAEQEMRASAEEAARQAREEAERIRREAEEEAARLLAAARSQRAQIEESARRRAKEQARHEVEEQARRKAEEQARHRAEEQARHRAEELARRRAQEQARHRAEELARHRAEEEAHRRAEQEARRQADADARRQEEIRRQVEARREAEEARRRAHEDTHAGRTLPQIPGSLVLDDEIAGPAPVAPQSASTSEPTVLQGEEDIFVFQAPPAGIQLTEETERHVPAAAPAPAPAVIPSPARSTPRDGAKTRFTAAGGVSRRPAPRRPRRRLALARIAAALLLGVGVMTLLVQQQSDEPAQAAAQGVEKRVAGQDLPGSAGARDEGLAAKLKAWIGSVFENDAEVSDR